MIRSLPALEAFYWVVRLGGFKAAADRLGVSQPAVSTRVKEMERRAGRTLLVRPAVRPVLTEHGAAAFDYAGRILSLVQDLEERLRQGGPVRGMLRLGVTDGFAVACLPSLLRRLSEAPGELRVAVTVGNSRTLEGRLRDGDLDLAILSARAEGSGDLRVRVLGEQEVAWIASPTLDLPTALTAETLQRQQIFSSPPPSHLFSVLTDWFVASGLPQPVLSDCDSVAVIASLVTAGAGISILPVCLVHQQLAAGTLVRLTSRPAPPRQRVVAAWGQAADQRTIRGILPLVRDAAHATGFVD